jgi:SAM-dependent methyltransferase
VTRTALASPTRVEVVCPECRGALTAPGHDGLSCAPCGSLYPVRSGVPVFLSPGDYADCLARLERERPVWEPYAAARRRSALTRLYYDWWVAEMFREVPATARGPILELMCGGAEISRRLPPRFDSGIAFDLNVFMLEDAARDLREAGETRVAVVGGTTARLPLRDASIGVVMIQGGLHHVRPLLDAALSEVHRVLAPDGLVVGSEPANDHPRVRRIRRWQDRRAARHGEDEEGFTRDEIGRALSQQGLRLRSYRRFGSLAYTLMGNADLLPLLAGCSSTALGRGLLLVDRAHSHLPLLRGAAFASLFTATKVARP